MHSRVVEAITIVVLVVLLPLHLAAQTAGTPEVLGWLTGPTSAQQPSGAIYGTDLGWTFEHKGRLHVVFGDSWARADEVCNGPAPYDDSQGLLPTVYPGGVPQLSYVTEPGAPDHFAPMQFFRDGKQLLSGQNATPMSAWSDGEHAFVVFQDIQYLECNADGRCPEPFACAAQVGLCQPGELGVSVSCEVDSQSGCSPTQVCRPTVHGLCVDPTSSPSSARFRTPLELELTIQSDADSRRYDSAFSFPSSKFLSSSARTVRNLGSPDQHDYRPGSGSVLLWGRPSFVGDSANNLQLYLLVHDLPMRPNASGKIDFHPRYFAGLDDQAQPIWSPQQGAAVPLALDGRPGGDPRELLEAVGQLTVSWLDAPINRWVMLYGGKAPWSPFSQPAGDAGGIPAGSLVVRYAEHPWGPWTPPQAHLTTGDPHTPGSLYGPGGWLYHPDCSDQGGQRCMRSDPVRFHDALTYCLPSLGEPDYGLLYAPNIIDAYTQPVDDHSLDVYWLASTWNPYNVLFLRSRFSVP